jgi:hypothetical protein
MLWVWLSRIWTEWRSAIVIVRPDTVIAWHRRTVRRFGTGKVVTASVDRQSHPTFAR